MPKKYYVLAAVAGKPLVAMRRTARFDEIWREGAWVETTLLKEALDEGRSDVVRTIPTSLKLSFPGITV